MSRVESLEIDRIVPQHGPIIENRDKVSAVLEWLKNLRCGLDLI